MPHLLLDSNLAVLLATGLANKSYIAKHKNLHPTYDIKDYNILTGLVAQSKGVLFSPHILAETSSLLRQSNDPMKSHISQSLANLINRSTETYFCSSSATLHRDYTRLGLTDAVMMCLCRTGATLLTADFDLYWAAASAGLNSVNYNHIREQRLDFR